MLQYKIPKDVLNCLEKVPKNIPIILLLRHSVRSELTFGVDSSNIPLTKEGVDLAFEFGTIIGNRLAAIHSSPLVRCVQTAEALKLGSAMDLLIVRDNLLGDPGVYISDSERAATAFISEDAYHSTMHHLVSSDTPLDGFYDAKKSCLKLLSHMQNLSRGQKGIHIFITHDSLIVPIALRSLGLEYSRESPPDFLGGVFFWNSPDARLSVSYKEHRRDNMQLSDLFDL